MSLLRRLLTAMTLAMALCAPLHAETAGQPQGAITVEDSAQQDAAIAVRIRDIMSELDGYGNVTVTVTSGIVTLRGTTLDSAASDQLNELVGRVQGVVAIKNEVTETTDVVERLNPAYERFKTRLLQAVAMLPLLGVALLAFVLVMLAGVLLARAKYPWDRIAPNAFIADIYRQIVRLFFVVAGIVIALDILNATALLGTILGAAGIVGLAIGFAVRDTVENFIASIMLSFRQPFRPNDTVEIEGDVGKVVSLTSRATILLSFDGNQICIPNSTVFKSRIINYTRNTERRFSFDVGVAPVTDLAAAKALALETVNKLPFVLATPAPAIWIETIGDSTIGIRVTGWIDQHETGFALARGEAIRHVLLAFEAAGIEMPEPTFRVVSPSSKSDSPAKPPVVIRKVETEDVQSTQNEALERIVDQERAERADKDLLTREGEEE